MRRSTIIGLLTFAINAVASEAGVALAGERTDVVSTRRVVVAVIFLSYAFVDIYKTKWCGMFGM